MTQMSKNMKYAVCFGDLVKVRGEWETAVRANERGVAILTPPRPTMDGSANPGFRFVRYDDIEDHIRAIAVPGAIEALIEIAAGKTTMVDGATVYMVMFEAQEIAEAALRAVRGEEKA